MVGRPMDPRAALQDRFGFEDFRPGQEEAVHAALSGRDVLVVMPTGAGQVAHATSSPRCYARTCRSWSRRSSR